MADKLARCIANNVHLCGAVLAPHSLSGTIVDGMWTAAGELPPYYPNVITVSSHGAQGQIRTIEGLARALAFPFSVKDSFAALDLGPLGFRSLFTADWIWRDPSPLPAPADSGPWQAITTADDLAAWETAWRDGGSPADQRIFLPGLLDNDMVTVLATRRGGRIVAGCIANRSGDVVGLSNFFAIADEWKLHLASAVAAVADVAPGSAIVGYERGDTLDAMSSLGFERIGRLCVWLSPER